MERIEMKFNGREIRSLHSTGNYTLITGDQMDHLVVTNAVNTTGNKIAVRVVARLFWDLCIANPIRNFFTKKAIMTWKYQKN